MKHTSFEYKIMAKKCETKSYLAKNKAEMEFYRRIAEMLGQAAKMCDKCLAPHT